MKNHRQIPPIEMRNRNADDVEKTDDSPMSSHPFFSASSAFLLRDNNFRELSTE
jgi:hypothetical protein